jgi:hypothetical protein
MAFTAMLVLIIVLVFDMFYSPSVWCYEESMA